MAAFHSRTSDRRNAIFSYLHCNVFLNILQVVIDKFFYTIVKKSLPNFNINFGRFFIMQDAVIMLEGTIYEEGYGLLAQKVMRDKTLPKQSKLIYAYMCAFAGVRKDGERTAFPSVSLQCAELGMTEDTYYKWRKPLVDKGYIKITKQRKEGSKFDRNIYSIVAVPKDSDPSEPPKEDKPKEEKPKKAASKKPKAYPKKPYPKKLGTEEKPSPNFSGTEKSGTEKSGTNINSSNSNSFNSNIKNQYQYLSEYIWQMKVPMPLKKFFSDKVKVLVDSDKSFDLTKIEYFYNSYADYIQPNCTGADSMYLNDIEFTDTMIKMYQQVERPIGNMEGLIKVWVSNRISFKIDNNSNLEIPVQEQADPIPYDFSKRQII